VGQERKGWSLHADPNSFSLSGFQITDFLSALGFKHGGCPFTDGRQCYAREISESFDLKNFVTRFDTAYNNLKEAQQRLQQCGYFFEQTEGWQYFGFGIIACATQSRLPWRWTYGERVENHENC
jgi:hypothetical protein